MLAVNSRCRRWSGEPAGDGEIAMDTVAEPSLWSQCTTGHEMGFHGEPVVGSLTINAPADAQHLGREDLIGKRQR
jgi:hypothetical protein